MHLDLREGSTSGCTLFQWSLQRSCVVFLNEKPSVFFATGVRIRRRLNYMHRVALAVFPRHANNRGDPASPAAPCWRIILAVSIHFSPPPLNRRPLLGQATCLRDALTRDSLCGVLHNLRSPRTCRTEPLLPGSCRILSLGGFGPFMRSAPMPRESWYMIRQTHVPLDTSISQRFKASYRFVSRHCEWLGSAVREHDCARPECQIAEGGQRTCPLI